MRWFARRERGGAAGTPRLAVEGLDVHYGRAHALQEVSLTLDRGVLAVVGRNGMGKTTLCNAITGLVPAKGSVRIDGREILGLPPHAITELGVGYVPQGRRVWPSLTVDEHLRLVARGSKGPWTIERIYRTFPRLAERKGNGGAQLSGGEQQMLAISRALLFNPGLLVMDEPTEGLAPVIVEQVATMLTTIAAGRRDRGAADRAEPRRRDRRRRHDRRDGQRAHRALDARVRARGRPRAAAAPARRRAPGRDDAEAAPVADAAAAADDAPPRILTVRRAESAPEDVADMPEEPRAVRGFTRWNAADANAKPSDRLVEQRAAAPPASPSIDDAATRLADTGRDARVIEFPVATSAARAAYIAGTFDTKGRELLFLQSCLEKLGVRTVTVDLSTSGRPSPAMVHPREVARHHPKGERAVFTGDRGTSVDGMAVAFEQFLVRRARPGRRDLGRRLGRHRARDRRDAAPADRRAEGDGVDGRLGRRAALRRPGRHLHDVLGHRRRRHQPHLGARARRTPRTRSPA